MKNKAILLLLFSMPFMLLSAKNYTTNRTYTVGNTYVIDPAADLGISYTNACDQRASSQDWNNQYKISDATAFSIVPVKKGTDYNSYKLTARKVGNYVFSQLLSENRGNYINSHTVTYNITVVDVKSISMDETHSMSVGDQHTLIPTISQAGAETTLTWTSSNTSVATVSNGKITAKGVGTTTITCTAHNGVSAKCVVTVNPVKVSGITLNETSADLTVGENLQLSATITPTNATDKSVTWSCTNESVAVVSESGLVTAAGSGTCQIKATANDGSGKFASCLVTVEKNNKLTVGNMTLCRGGQGTMHVLLTDEEVVSGFQFDLALPADVTVPTDKDGQLMAKLGSRASSHTITASKVGEGLYRFVVVSMANKPITQGEGDVMTITLEADANMAMQEYEVKLQDIGLTVKQGSDFVEIHPRDNTAKLTVTDVVPGDVNGDGNVSVTDVISIISYVLEDEPTRFIFNAADVNHDGQVTVTDAIIVIDMILNK